MSNNNIDNSNNSNANTNDNATPWVDVDLVRAIKDSLAVRGITKTNERIRRMAYELSDDLTELMWNAVPIEARANLVSRAYWNRLGLDDVVEELGSVYMLRDAVDQAIANAPSMIIPAVFRNSVYKRALKCPARFVAQHHKSFTDPKSSYTTASKYTSLKDRKVLVLAHILGVLA